MDRATWARRAISRRSTPPCPRGVRGDPRPGTPERRGRRPSAHVVQGVAVERGESQRCSRGGVAHGPTFVHIPCPAHPPTTRHREHWQLECARPKCSAYPGHHGWRFDLLTRAPRPIVAGADQGARRRGQRQDGSRGRRKPNSCRRVHRRRVSHIKKFGRLPTRMNVYRGHGPPEGPGDGRFQGGHSDARHDEGRLLHAARGLDGRRPPWATRGTPGGKDPRWSPSSPCSTVNSTAPRNVNVPALTRIGNGTYVPGCTQFQEASFWRGGNSSKLKSLRSGVSDQVASWSGWSGRVTVNWVTCASDSTAMAPPWARTISALM